MARPISDCTTGYGMTTVECNAVVATDTAKGVDFGARQLAHGQNDFADIMFVASLGLQFGLQQNDGFNERLFARKEVGQVRIVATVARRELDFRTPG